MSQLSYPWFEVFLGLGVASDEVDDLSRRVEGLVHALGVDSIGKVLA